MPGSQLAVDRYLQDHHVATLATSAGDVAWAAAVFYVNDGHTLYFLSSPTSRHCANLARNPRVAVTIQEDHDDWRTIKGVQLAGNACEIGGAEADRARTLYVRKFPFVEDAGGDTPAVLARAMRKIRWYKVVPTVLYFIDNSAGFGQRREIDLRGAGRSS